MANKQKTLGKILIADDETYYLKALGCFLEQTGYEVLLADGGAKCIQLAQEKKPDLVLLDISMPDISGERVLAEIRNRQIPTRVIMFTAYFRAIEDAIRFIKAGACDYLLKPVSKEEIQNAIQRALVLESTMNLVSSNPTPLVNKLMAETEELQHQATELSKQVQHLQRKDKWDNLLIRLLFLFAASLVTLIFYWLQLITNSQSLILLPIIIFVLLLLPIERIRSFSAKHKESEATFKIDANKD